MADVANAEADLRTSLSAKGREPEEVDDAVAGVKADPNRYAQRQNEFGTLARCLLSAHACAIVPFVPQAQPAGVVRQPSVIDIDGSPRLMEHRHFVPLGPVVKPNAPAGHHFSHMKIDHSVSGFAVGSEEEKAVILIYEHLMYESKLNPPCKEVPTTYRQGPDCTRGPFFTVREHNHAQPRDPSSHKEVLIFGSTQLSKTPEAAATAWCAFFIDGCVPIIGVRNKGGANTGSCDMASGVEKLNKRITELFHHEVAHNNIDLRKADASKLLLRPRKTSDGEQLEFDPNSFKLSRPQVLIICMNSGQVKNLIGKTGSKATSKAGATAGLLDIMKGMTEHPYPPKCHDPYAELNSGVNRPLARIYFILDEDDLNRSNTPSATEKLQFDCSPDVMRRLEAGLDKLYPRPHEAAGSANDPLPLDSDGDVFDDDEDEPALAARGAAAAAEDPEAAVEARNRNEFLSAMETTGVRSAVRGVVALTATPAACGHDLAEAASKVKHQICEMEHPANYVGYEFTAASYAERTIKHEPVPDRKQIVQIKKGLIYKEVLKKKSWWDDDSDSPMPPFRKRPSDGAIMVYQRDLDDHVEEGGLSSRALYNLVNKAHRQTAIRGDKVLESDGVGIALMLQSMSSKPPSEEQERRALIVSNYTRTNELKIKLARHILEGDLMLEDGQALPGSCVGGLFIIVFDHKSMRIMWRGSTSIDDDVTIPPDHDSLAVLTAIRHASHELYEGCCTANKKTGTDPRIEDEGQCKMFRTTFININHVYTALQLYACNQRRITGQPFKLKTIALSGDLGGRGVNFKPHGCGHNLANGTYKVQPHQGYLTDMFFMFDAVKNRQITTHGEYTLQAIGRLCTLTTDEELQKMEKTPPRLWTSSSCYNIIKTFACAVNQWVAVMQTKQVGESISEAVERCIKANPDRFCELYMVYVLPTTDRRWAKKDLWVRQSRLMKADKFVGERLRAKPWQTATPRTHGIAHNPDNDARKRMLDSIDKAEAMVVDGDNDDGAGANGGDEMPHRVIRRRTTITQAKFDRIYQQHPELAFSETTAPDGQQPMPTLNSKIWVKWSDWRQFPHYPATVVDITLVSTVRDDARVSYSVRFETNDMMEELPDALKTTADIELDPDMNEWQYKDPNQ